MENKKITIPVIIVLVIAVVSLGIAFATFSTVLNINGSADVAATSWDIFFTTEDDGAKPTQSTPVPIANISNAGTSASSNSATIVATTFTWNANFQKPGDKIIYTIYVKNGGSYNAQVSNITKPAITCTGDTNSACSHLSYNLYTDNAGNTPLTTSFTVAAGETEVFYLIATLDSEYGGNDGSGLVQSDLTTDTISATVTFQQASSAVSNSNSGNSGGNGGGNSGGNSQSSNLEYFIGDSYSSYSDDDAEYWSLDYDDLINKNVYVKRSNGDYSVCYAYNSQEYCFTPYDDVTSFNQSCSAVSGTSMTLAQRTGDNGDNGFYCVLPGGEVYDAEGNFKIDTGYHSASVTMIDGVTMCEIGVNTDSGTPIWSVWCQLPQD